MFFLTKKGRYRRRWRNQPKISRPITHENWFWENHESNESHWVTCSRMGKNVKL